MSKFKIAFAGGAGKIEKFAGIIRDEGSEPVAVWDYDEARGRKNAERINCPFEADYGKLLTGYHVDGVVIITENAFKKDALIQAAHAGKHIFLEKPLTVFPQEAREMQQAIHDSGVTFFMSDPFVRRGTIKAKQMIEAGKLGRVTGGRIRLGTTMALMCEQRGTEPPPFDPKLSLGGIMADTGGHMLHIAHYLFGMPSELCAAFDSVTQNAKAHGFEDTAIMIFRYPDGKLITVEATNASSASTGALEIYGTKGCLWIHENENRENGKDSIVFRYDREPEEILSDDQLAQEPIQHVRYWLKMLDKQIPNDQIGIDPLSNSGVSIDSAVDLVDMISAAYTSAAADRFVKVR